MVLETETVARAILLGGIRPAWRVEIAMSASISQKKGGVITRKAFDRMLAEPILIASGPATRSWSEEASTGACAK